MKTIEAMRWDVVNRLVNVEYSLQRIGFLTNDERLYNILVEASKKITEAKNIITPLAEERPAMVHIMEEYDRDQ